MTARAIPWNSRRRRFAANVQALAQRDPIGAELVQAAGTNLEQFELFSAADGNYFVRDTKAPQPGWLGGLINHKTSNENVWQFDRVKNPLPRPIIFEGLGYGWLLFKVLQTTERTYVNYSCAVHIVEGDPTALAMLFYMHDLQDLIAQPRLQWFVRPSPNEAFAAFREAIRAHSEWTVPEHFVRCKLRPAAPLPMEQTIKELLSERNQLRDRHLAQAADYYSKKDAACWAKRFEEATIGRGDKLRVLGITSRCTTVLQYSMAELKTAIDATGCDMQIAIEPDDHSQENPYPQIIADFKPDLIILISRMRYENPWLPKNVPFLCWDQDNLPCTRTDQATASMDALTFVAGHAALFGAMHLNWPLRNCIFCHPAGMTHRYGAKAGVEDTARFGSDVSYVSHASGTPETLRDSLAERWQRESEFLGLFRAACGEVISGTRGGRRYDFAGFEELIRRAEAAAGRETPAQLRNELLTNLTLVSDRVFRHETLEWVARWCEARGKRLRIWGNGWEGHRTLGKYAAGAALPGEQAQHVYRSSVLNLQIIETGMLHSRVLDGWASGGFFLIRQNYRADEEGLIMSMWRIGQWSQEQGVETIRELENRGSDELRKAWSDLERHYRDVSRDAVFPGFRIWRSLPPAKVLIPGVEDILFNDEKGFGELADRYSDRGELRQEMLAKIRESLHKHLSYDARWRDFMSHLRKHL